MKPARILASLGASLTLAACATGAPPPASVVVIPGTSKTQAAFQEDQAVCHRHAMTQSGYGIPSASPTGTPATGTAAAAGNRATTPAAPGAMAVNAPIPVATETPADVSYVQCMAARGNTVRMVSAGSGAPGDSYGYPYAAAYPYPYAYPYGYPYGYDYPFAYDGFAGGWGWGWGGGYYGHGWHDGGWHGGGWHDGGFHDGGWHGGAWHGGGFHDGGWHGGGFHGGGWHGGGFHGGGFHGGGGGHR